VGHPLAVRTALKGSFLATAISHCFPSFTSRTRSEPERRRR
jgi:hypothetical protein